MMKRRRRGRAMMVHWEVVAWKVPALQGTTGGPYLAAVPPDPPPLLPYL
jgi:hypothetical protein